MNENSNLYLQPYVKPQYLIIEALEDGLTASLSVNACEYCVDGDGNWKTLAAGTATESIAAGQTLYFKRVQAKGQGGGTFTISKKCNLNGNCMSMVFGDDAKGKTDLSEYRICFSGLFRDCTTIVSVNDDFLPATTLASSCYENMFRNCTSLTTAPKLPATTLSSNCYYSMFQGCTSLTTAPSLPATTLAERCYGYMFQGCTSLTTAPELPATMLSSRCYYMMFIECSSLTTAPELPATTLADNCYEYMFSNCSSLTTAPELPATTLAENCYSSMFAGCSSLTTAPELPATTLSEGCYGTMFVECSSLTTAPELPATTLVPYCYAKMFRRCPNLNYIKMLATDISADRCLYDWVNGVSSTGTFVKNSVMTNLPTGISGIPSGWTVVNDGEESGGNEEGGHFGGDVN